ncbi:MAG: FkbM family methyltransferase [Sulfitobacter sp.]|nr:FkbM family methyltransferase [Sulfitobacter sp.]
MSHAVGAHLKSGRPALAGYGFDHITVMMHIDGRFADRELSALEKKLFPQLPRDGVCLDIGANIGNHAVSFADSFAQVHAFEPNHKALELLQINARLKPNITVHPVGLSDRDQTLTGTQPEGNLGGTGAGAGNGKVTGETVELPLRRLDDMDLGLDGSPITFVKIDVEGHEAEVIRGASETLSRHRPVIGMEVDRHTVNGGSSPALEAAFDLGYTHMYAMLRGRSMKFRAVSKAAARNHPMLILSMEALDLG